MEVFKDMCLAYCVQAGSCNEGDTGGTAKGDAIEADILMEKISADIFQLTSLRDIRRVSSYMMELMEGGAILSLAKTDQDTGAYDDGDDVINRDLDDDDNKAITTATETLST